MAALPAAGSYHGMFAHVHSTGRGYFAHAGNWLELVNADTTGRVGTGTESYFIDRLVSTSTTATSLNVTGVTTTVTLDVNGDIDVDGHTNLDNVSVAGVSTFAGNVDINNVNVTGVATFRHRVKLLDNDKLQFGNSDDLEIYHDGGTSHIVEKGTGGLSINSTNGYGIDLIGNSEYLAKFRKDSVVELYHDGNLKLSTASSGINVVGTTTSTQLAITGVSTFTGNIDANGDLDVDGHTNLDNVSIAGVTTFSGNIGGTATFQDIDVDGHTNLDNVSIAGVTTFSEDVTFTTANGNNILFDKSDNQLEFGDSVKATFGTENDLNIFHNGTNSYIDNNQGDLVIGSSGTLRLVNVNNTESFIKCITNSAVEIYHDNSKKFETTAYGTNTTGTAVNDGLVVAGVATVTTMNVTGVLTYDDVTSVDSVGFITARSGIKDSTLTSGRVVTAGTDGRLQDSAVLTFDGSSLSINSTGDQMLNLNSTDNGGTYIGYNRSGTRTAFLGHGGTGGTFTLRNEIANGNVQIIGLDGSSYVTMLQFDTANSGNATFSGDLTVSGTTTTVNTETINLADNLILINSNHTGSPSQDGGIEINRGSSANKTFVWDETNDRWSVGSETLYSTGLVRGGQVVGDSGTISNLASTTHTASTITANNTTSVNVTSTNLVAGVNATFDSATIGNLSITNMLASSGDSATFTNIANTQFTGSQATIDSATIGNLNADSSDIRQVSTEFINFDSAFGDSATITNLANTQLTASQITVDSATINTLNVDSSDVRQISTEFINFDSAFGDSATVTNLATTQLTVANANIDSANITNLSSTNFTMSSGDSATITNIANTQLTGSQATLDSATITKLNVDSADIDHFSAENINFDSATGDSATITNIASANINVDQLFTDSATITNIANSVLTAKAITNTTLVGDSATITNIANSVLTAKAITGTSADIDSATIGNLATTQITLSQVTADSATINTINADSSDIRQFSTEFINADSAFIDSATIGGIALGNNDLVTTGKLYYANVFSSEGDLPDANSHHGMFAHVHGTGKGYFAHAGAWHQLLDKSSANDSATITNLANSVLTAKAITGTSANIDSATIGNLANTQFTSSQITSDSATINTLNADSSDIRQFSTEFINFDSAFGDSATITNIANSVLTAKAITNTTLVGDSATITNIASSQLTGGSASFSGDVILDSSGAIQFDKSDQALEFGDNYKATFGTGGDLEIYHDGANSFIKDGGTGNLVIRSNLVDIQSADGSENLAKFTENSSVKLYFNGSEKLSTSNTGASITGLMASTTATADSGTIGNLATTQITGSQATFDSADIGNLRTTGVLQTDSVNATQLELLTGVTNVPAHKEGRLFYDDSNKTIGFYSDVSGLVHEVGIEEHQRVYNNTGSTIAKGKPVYFSGNYTGGAVDVPTVALADATDTAKYNAQGLTAVAIPNNSYGYIQTSGQLSGLDTSGLSAGQKVFVGLGSGLLSNSTPLYPNYPICLGWCVSSNASTGVILLNRQAHTIDSLRVVTSGHIGSNLQIDGNLTVLGSTTSVSSADLTAGTPMFRLNEGNAIGEAGTTFSGTGLDDAFYSGFFTGTTNQNYYVRIDGVGTGAGGVDTFEVAFGADSTFSSPVLTKQVITGSPQMIHSTDNISINFASTTGHDSGARWAGTAGPINVDTGFFSNRNTGGSGVGFTYVGIYLSLIHI